MKIKELCFTCIELESTIKLVNSTWLVSITKQ